MMIPARPGQAIRFDEKPDEDEPIVAWDNNGDALLAPVGERTLYTAPLYARHIGAETWRIVESDRLDPFVAAVPAVPGWLVQFIRVGADTDTLEFQAPVVFWGVRGGGVVEPMVEWAGAIDLASMVAETSQPEYTRRYDLKYIP